MDILDQLQDIGAVFLDQHFVYKSRKHGAGYREEHPNYAGDWVELLKPAA